MKLSSIQKRSKSDSLFPFRQQSRFVFNNGFWFYFTREGLEGPYATKAEAEIEAMLMIRSISHMDTFGFDRVHKFTQAAI